MHQNAGRARGLLLADHVQSRAEQDKTRRSRLKPIVLISEMKNSETITGFLKSLKKQGITLTEKVQLVHRILSNGSKFPNKYQIILDWTSQELISSTTKNVCPQDTIHQLWEILAEVIRRNQLEKDQSFLTLRPGLVDVFTKAFENERNFSMALLECCAFAFRWNGKLRPLTVKFDKFVIMFAKVLQCLTTKSNKLIEQENENEEMCKSILALTSLISTLLLSFQKLQKQLSDPVQIFAIVCENFLHQVIMFRSVIEIVRKSNRACSFLQDIEKVYFDLQSVIKSSVLVRECLQCMKNTLDLTINDTEKIKENEVKKKKKTSCFESLINLIENGFKNESMIVFTSVLDFLPELFRMIINANRKSMIMQHRQEFAFFRVIHELILEHLQHSPHGEACQLNFMQCSRSLLEALLAFGIFRVNDDTVNTDDNYATLQSIEKACVKYMIHRNDENVKMEAFQCLNQLVEVDYHIINPDITWILRELVQIPSENNQETSTLVKKKEEFFIHLLGIYGKSRQMDKLLGYLLLAIKGIDNGGAKLSLPSSVQKGLAEIASTLSAGQVVSLLEVLLHDVSQLVKDLSDCAKNQFLSAEDFHEQCQKLEFVIDLYEILAVNAHIIPHGGHIGLHQQKYIDSFTLLDENALKPLILVCSELSLKGDFKDEAKWLVYKIVAHAAILSLKISMLTGNRAATERCTVELKHSTEYCLKAVSSREDVLLYDATKVIISYLELVKTELPWLVNVLGRDAVLDLNELMFIYLGTGNTEQKYSSSLCTILGDEHNFMASLLSSAHFYDNLQMQDCFCEVLSRKLVECVGPLLQASEISSINDKFNKLNTTAKELELESKLIIPDSNSCNIDDDESMDFENDNLMQMENGISLKPIPSKQNEEEMSLLFREFLDLSLATGSSRDLKLKTSDCFDNAIMYLQIIKMVRCEWLLPYCKRKLLFACLLAKRELLPKLKKSSQKGLLLKRTLGVISHITSSCLSIHHACNTFDSIDPASIIYWMLGLFEKLHDKVKLPMEELSDAMNNLWKVLISSKRPKDNDEMLNQLAEKVYQLCETTETHPSEVNLTIFATLFSVTYETISSPAKKHSVITSTTLVYPIMKLLLSVNPFAGTDCIDAVRKDHGLLSIRLYGYLIAICRSMKISRKHARLVTMQSELNWDNHLKVYMDLLKNITATLSKEDLSETISCSFEKTCLDCLQLVYASEDAEEISQLVRIDFAEETLLGLLSLVERRLKIEDCSGRHLPKREDYCRESSESNLEDLPNVTVCLEFIDYYLLNIKKNKEKQKNVRSILAKIIYICIEVIGNERAEFVSERAILVAYKVIVETLGFSRAMINNSHCIATLHLYCMPRKATTKARLRCGPQSELHGASHADCFSQYDAIEERNVLKRTVQTKVLFFSCGLWSFVVASSWQDTSDIQYSALHSAFFIFSKGAQRITNALWAFE
eukprot:gene15638-17217_t